MVYKDENHTNIINIYKLFIDKSIYNNPLFNESLWVEIQDAIILNEKYKLTLMIQRYNDIKLVCPIRYSSIKKVYKNFKLITVNDYEIIKIY